MSLSLGSLLAGRYEITAPVAVGGMGEVWKARDRVLDRIVAAKVLRSEYTGDPNFLARFRNEARHTAALSHPNIASVYDYGETVDERTGANLAFLVMEFVEGQPLVSILHEEGKLPVDWTLHVVGQSADGLSAAHRAGVVHRDIKPGNLMVRPDGVVKLTDFGIAQARDAAPLTRTGMVVGTAQYLSPEQAQGFEVTAASDVYSLGVVAYECLTGVRPFDGTSQVAVALAHINRPPPPLPRDIPPGVRALVERALAKDPAQRFPDGGAFAEAIRDVASGGSPAAAGPVTGAVTEVIAAPEGTTQVFSGPGTGATTTAQGRPAPQPGPRTLPQLQGPPVDGDPAGGEPREDEPARRSRRWLWVAAIVLVVLLVGGGTYFLLSGNRSAGNSAARGSATTSASGTSAGAVATVPVDTSSFIGQPYDDVRATLTRQGLTVVRREASAQLLAGLGRKLAPNAVAGSDPADRSVPAGSTVTLVVASNGYTPDAGTSTSRAPTTSTAPTTSSAPTSSSAPETSSAAPTTPATTTTPAPTTAPPATSTAAGSSLPADTGAQNPPVEQSTPSTESGPAAAHDGSA